MVNYRAINASRGGAQKGAFFLQSAIKTLPRCIRVTLPRKKRSGPTDQNFKRRGVGAGFTRGNKTTVLRACFLQVRKFKSFSRRARAFTVGYKNRRTDEERRTRACCGFNQVYVISRFRFPAECRHEIRVARRVRGTWKNFEEEC